MLWIAETDVPLCIILHHGGKWEIKQGLKYVGGTVELLNDIPSNLDVPYLKSVISLLGYTDVIKLHYCDPLKSLQNGIRFLGYEDVTFTKFKSLLDEYRMIDVFIEHDDCDDEGNNVAINSTITEQSIPKNIVNSFVSVNCENNNQEIEKDVDYDELGSDNEDDEVREARFLIQDEKKAENEYLNEEDSLVRLAERKGKILEDNDGDYEDGSSDFESPPNSEDEDDYGYLLPKDSKKKKVKMASNQLFLEKMSNNAHST
ncbi:DNA-directed RNA polymerase subunit beta' [Bienertia sinuspersici]